MILTPRYTEMNQAVPGGASLSPGHEGGYGGECQVPSPSQWSDPCYSPPSFHSPQHLPGELDKIKEEPFSPSPPTSCAALCPSPPALHHISPYARPQVNQKKEGYETSLNLSELLAENQALTNLHQQVPHYPPYPDHPLLRGRLEDNSFQKKMALSYSKVSPPSSHSSSDGLGFLDMLVDVKQEVEEEVSVGSPPAAPAPLVALVPSSTCQKDILETVEQLALEHARRDVQRISDSLNIPRDPAQWNVADVRAWLNLQATQLQLPPLILSFWNLGGPALLKLTEAEFRQLAPVGGELLYAQLEIWRGALRAVPKVPQYQHWQRYHRDPILMQVSQLPQQQHQQQQQVPQNNQLESPSPLGSPSHQLGSQSQLGSPSHQIGSQSQLGSPSHQLGSQSQLGSPSHQLGSPSHQLGSPSHQLGSPSHQLGSPSHQLGSPSHLAPSQLGSPSYLGSPSSPPMSLTANMSQVPTPVVQVTQQQQQQQQQQQHLQAGGAGTCQPQPAAPAPQPQQQQQQQQQASGGVYLEEQRLDMTALLQQQANSPKAAHTPRVPAHSPQDDAYDSDDEAEDDGCVSGNTSSGRGGTHIHLWQFLKGLLEQPQPYGSCIRWIDRQKAVFKIEDSVRVARLWGKRKNRPAMNYDKLSRSIRQYYKKGIMKKTERSQRLVYQFCHPYCL